MRAPEATEKRGSRVRRANQASNAPATDQARASHGLPRSSAPAAAPSASAGIQSAVLRSRFSRNT